VWEGEKETGEERCWMVDGALDGEKDDPVNEPEPEAEPEPADPVDDGTPSFSEPPA
jgi:hypothetical protein